MGSLPAAVGLLDRRRLRAIYLAVRRDVGGDVRYETDATLVALVEDPYGSLEDASTRLDRLKDLLCRREDRRAVFLTIYTAMTEAVQGSIERGRFADPEWMRAYTVTFADYYREAFLAFEERRLRAVPDPWRIAFNTAVAGNALVSQDAFLGINAHINYDLALALHEVGIDSDRETKHEDHRTIDDVLARLVDAQQDALSSLYAPGIDDVDATLGRLDESVSLFTLTEGREQAWRVAVVLTDTDSRTVETLARWVLRTTAIGGAVVVLTPSLDPDLMQALRRVERDRFDLADTIDALDYRFDTIDY